MSSKKISLPSVPKNADRDTTVFLQSLKKAVEKMSADELVGINKAVQSYVLRSNKKIRADLVGVIGNEMGVGPILDKIRGQITESELSKELGTRIEKIISNENAISEERLQRVADVLAANDAVVAERQARVQAITDSSDLLQKDIEAEALERFNVTDGLRQDLVQEIQTRSDETGQLISDFDGIYAQVNPDMAGDIDRWAGEDSYFAGVWSERSAIIEKDMAMSKRTDGLLSSINDNKASITQVNKTLVTKNEVVASQINRLAAQMVGGYNGDDLSQVTSGLIHQERTARATDIEGLAEQVSLLSAGVGEQFDSFEIWHFDKDKDGWVNGVYANGWVNVRTETINSPVVDIDGGMYRHVKLRIQKIGTPTWGASLTYSGGSLTSPEPEYTEDGFAIVNFYLEWSGTIAGFNIKLASSANNLNYFKIDWIAVGRPSPGASHAALLREEKARADKDSALAQSITSLDTQINGDGVNSSSSIVQKLNTTASKADTTAEDLSNLTSTFDDEVMGAQGVVARNAQTAASASAANASDISGVYAQVNPRMAGDTDWLAGDNSPEDIVGVWSERSARMESDLATSQKFDAVYARVGDNTAAISLESKTRIDEIKALAEQTETIRADFEGNAGVMQTQIEANATAHSALSKRTDTIQSSVGKNTASVQTAQSAINGINAKWSIKTDVNGVVGGLAIENNGSTVDFIVRAGSFAIQGQSGSKSVPFVSYPDGTIIDGEVIPAGNYLEDAYIRRASIDTLDIKGNAVTVPVSAFTEGSITVGTSYKTIQSLAVPSDMGHTMLNFNAIFNFPGYARVQSILCRIVKGGVVIADNIEVFFSEARSETRTSNTISLSHNHSGTFQGGIYTDSGYQSIGGNVNIGYGGSPGHSHRVDIANDNRNAGTFSLSRHDSTGVAGIYELQMRVSNGGTANLSQRYIHAITMRR